MKVKNNEKLDCVHFKYSLNGDSKCTQKNIVLENGYSITYHCSNCKHYKKK